jgi:hypothetical protein
VLYWTAVEHKGVHLNQWNSVTSTDGKGLESIPRKLAICQVISFPITTLFLRIPLEILKLPILHDSKDSTIFHYSLFTFKVLPFSFVYYLSFFLVIPATPPCCPSPVKTLRLLHVFRLLTLCGKMSTSVGKLSPLLTGPVLICDILKSIVHFFPGCGTFYSKQFTVFCVTMLYVLLLFSWIFIVFSVAFLPLVLLGLHVTKHLLNSTIAVIIIIITKIATIPLRLSSLMSLVTLQQHYYYY